MCEFFNSVFLFSFLSFLSFLSLPFFFLFSFSLFPKRNTTTNTTN